MTDVSALHAVPLFAELSDDDLARLALRTTEVVLEVGEQLFAEGDHGDSAFVIVRGALEITKRSGDRDVLLATRRPGEVIGEMALLQDAPRSATARAVDETELISIPRAEIDELLDTSSEAVRALFKVLLERWQATQVLLAQSERMAQLGTLSAGLAHELNNPAAAVNRSAGQLREAIGRLVTTSAAIEHAAEVEALRGRIAARPVGDRADAITRADMESEVEDRLTDSGVQEAWRVASMVVEAGLTEFLDEIIAAPESESVLSVLLADHEVRSLLYEVEEGTRRMSAIVRALMSYSYLDRGTVQQVDLVQGIEDTLLMLRPKLADIDVVTEFHPDLPQIHARGSELNQVWTNIIDNAAYSISTSEAGGTIVIRAFPEADGVVVEIEDDGPGFTPEHRERAFDSFFTTKPPGAGTGLGLSITYGIVVDSHRGDISIDSEPGRTVFRVVLPATIED